MRSYHDDPEYHYECDTCGATQNDPPGPGHECPECGATGQRGMWSAWNCPNCGSVFVGSRPSAGSGGVKGCNRCFIGVPEDHLRDAIESGDVASLERFLPDPERSVFREADR